MKFLKRIAAITLALTACFAMFGCKKSDKPKTGWKVVAYDFTQGVSFNVTRNSKAIDEVWLNVGKLEIEEVTITFTTSSSAFTSSSTNKKTASITKIMLKEANKSNSGWIKVVDDWNVSSSYIRFDLDGGITLNEIAFVDEDGKQLTATVDKANIYVKDNIPSSPEKYFTSDELAEMSSTNGMPANLLDEQEKFKV